jgi:hypothetical protein
MFTLSGRWRVFACRRYSKVNVAESVQRDCATIEPSFASF